MSQSGGFGVYIHWPYCGVICPYCDFNVYRQRQTDPEPLLKAIADDIAAQAQRFECAPAQSVFFGGGTPSLLEAPHIEQLLEAVHGSVGLAPGAEITIEANPEDAARFAGHAAAGVNRFSIGLQSLREEALKSLGRRHDVAAGLNAVEAAARTGQRVSVDLIYARHGQTEAEWSAELAEALALPVGHYSLYQLTIEADTAFARAAARGRIIVPDADRAAAFYELTQAMCDAAGAPAYEVSNHARTVADRAVHNMIYWSGGTWIGAGPGAHARLHDRHGRRVAARAFAKPDAYCAAVAANGVGFDQCEPLTPEEEGDERLLMGLRSDVGVPLDELRRTWGRPLNRTRADALAKDGLIELSETLVRVTRKGMLLADAIALELARP